MNKNDFAVEYAEFAKKALECAEKARREGLLALEESIDQKKVENRDVFEYGIRFVVDGTDSEIIKMILTNIIEQEKNEYSRTLMKIKLCAVLQIQSGMNPQMLLYMLNSYTDLSLADDPAIAAASEKPEPDTDGKYEAWV